MLVFFLAFASFNSLKAQKSAYQGNKIIPENGTSKAVYLDSSGKLVYEKDKDGNRIPDFSNVGYHSGEKALPQVRVMETLKPSKGDDTQRIQDALDRLRKLPLDKLGHRGALLLKRGIYRVSGTININYSGIVLKGEGNGPNGTTIVATGYGADKYKRVFISVGNRNDIQLNTPSKQIITDDYVPIGTHSFSVKSAAKYATGDRIVVFRPSTEEWISAIGCDKLESRWDGYRDTTWIRDDAKAKSIARPSTLMGTDAEVAKAGKKPGFYFQRLGFALLYSMQQKEGERWEDFEKRVPLSKDKQKFNFTRQWEAGEYDFYFERKITNIKGNKITIDAPIVHPMETKYGGGAIYHYSTDDRITEVGIENLRLISEFAPPVANHPYGSPEFTATSEQHAWEAILLNKNTENTWVKNVTGNYFGYSMVSISGKHATVQDCVNLSHASKIDGGRRYSFMIDGQLNLVQRCITFGGRHEFVTQVKTLGPNVFVDGIGVDSKEHAGPHQRYATGTLYDNIKSDEPMESRFRGNEGTGHGWAGTQICFYNCVAPAFLVFAPDGTMSWVIGSGSTKSKAIQIKPPSLYYKQVEERLGKAALRVLSNEKQLKNMGKYKWADKVIGD